MIGTFFIVYFSNKNFSDLRTRCYRTKNLLSNYCVWQKCSDFKASKCVAETAAFNLKEFSLLTEKQYSD